jgi:hypothetical protein
MHQDLIKELESELAIDPSLIQALFENPSGIVVKNLQKATKVRQEFYSEINTIFRDKTF